MKTPRFSALVLACFAASVQAQVKSDVQGEEQVIVTGALVQRAIQDAPYAISVVGSDELRSAGPMINLSEAMARVPGLVVNNRSNYAQDLQISSRGFGARAGFGVRGIRLYSDGIPASGPDGQGQVSHFDLASAQRVEVLRGPYSVLYGNSSGGVINVIGASAKTRAIEGEVDVGSFGLTQLRVAVSAPLGDGLDVRIGASNLRSVGFRPHSLAHRDAANLRLGWNGPNDSVTVVGNTIDQPAQDPLGLTRAQLDADPRQTTSVATQFDTRKNAKQSQLGASWRHRFDAGVLRDVQVAAYGGERSVTQYLAIAAATQANVRHSGGVVDFKRDYQGLDARMHWGWDSADVLLGAAIDRQRDLRKGYENFTGTGATQVLGVLGKLRRDEVDKAQTQDVFAQGEWTLAQGLVASAGLRSGQVQLSAADAYLSNGDDSGKLTFHYSNPVLGLKWQAAQNLNFHASVARGFESPTLGELAYQPSGAAGLNLALKPQTSTQAEIGAKWREGAWAIDAAIFEAHVADEIGVASNTGGRATFQNVGRTLRRGLELAAAFKPAGAWRASASATWLDASYRNSFLTCAGVPCTTPTLSVKAGNRIAGTQRASSWGEMVWKDAALGEWAVEARAVGRTPVNDVNSDAAPGYGLMALRWTRAFAVGPGRVELIARVDNLADRRYAGSVIVGEGNARFFEPGAPRSLMVGLRVIGAP